MNKKTTKPRLNKQEKIIKGVEDKMTLPQIESELKSLENQLQDLINQGRYNQAEECNQKIEHLKSVLRQRKTKEISRRHFTEKRNLIQDKVSDIDSLNYLWEQRFEELQAKSKSALEELRKNQEEELQQLLLQFQQSSNEVKPSSIYLKLKKEEEGLVKLRKFKEAQVIRKQKENQRKIDESKNGANKEISYNNCRKKLRQKHMNELQYLQNKFQAEFDELAKEKQKDMEFLDKKYSVKSKDLINQQKREDTVNKFKNYGNRIANLSNNYEIKYSVGKNEYKEPKKEEKADRIYAELNDENNKYIEEENEKTPKREKIENNQGMKHEIESENVKDNLENGEDNEELKDVEIPEYEN